TERAYAVAAHAAAVDHRRLHAGGGADHLLRDRLGLDGGSATADAAAAAGCIWGVLGDAECAGHVGQRVAGAWAGADDCAGDRADARVGEGAVAPAVCRSACVSSRKEHVTARLSFGYL